MQKKSVSVSYYHLTICLGVVQINITCMSVVITLINNKNHLFHNTAEWLFLKVLINFL